MIASNAVFISIQNVPYREALQIKRGRYGRPVNFRLAD
jgi:hypothetical protein